jgi:hypothetical protein
MCLCVYMCACVLTPKALFYLLKKHFLIFLLTPVLGQWMFCPTLGHWWLVYGPSVFVGSPGFWPQHKEVMLFPPVPKTSEAISVSLTESSSLALWLTKTNNMQVDWREKEEGGRFWWTDGNRWLLLNSPFHQSMLQSAEWDDSGTWTVESLWT